jgi:hypothetical protein
MLRASWFAGAKGSTAGPQSSLRPLDHSRVSLSATNENARASIWYARAIAVKRPLLVHRYVYLSEYNIALVEAKERCE